ncbi:restriction endonuclease [Methylobacterium sp. J-092]|uniref:restriction endonuclease n=1 Tax=Methylobacterium sp. J-092 TaxID=2836667 RepID=UPI001FBA4257|nr:restriction endonuclease [Methylobacterium sp. J-092]MCJ2008681.1 restriction endonuclease [Methylobacterium sp. J-092]
MISTTEKGDSFRDTVANLLDSAGFRAVSEVRRQFKKVDIEAIWNDRLDGPTLLLIEAKNYEKNLDKEDCMKFIIEYETLLESKKDRRAWLVSKSDISPDGRALIDARHGLKCFTYHEMQRWIFDLTDYTHELIGEFDQERIETYFIPPKTSDGEDLDGLVDKWLHSEVGQPLAITGSYGIGKTTFAKHLSARLGKKSISDVTARVPILIP